VASCRPGDVVLLSFPFADATGAKRRPALATLEKHLVERRLGALTPNDWRQVQIKIQQIWGLEQTDQELSV